MDILSITNKESVSADAKVYTKDGSDFVTATFDALYKNSSAKTNIEKSVSDANARIDNTNNTVAELDNYARAKANGIVLQSQGEMVTVNDSSDDYAVNLKPYGKSEQDSTTGKNLLQNVATTTTTKGITFTVNEDGSITANGTSTDRAQLDLGTNILPAGSYILSQGHAINYSVCVFASYKVNGEYKYIDLDSAVGGEISFTLDSETSVSVKADVRNANRNIPNITLYPMIRKADVTDQTYEPYTGGQPSPSPQCPKEIRSTVISEVRSCGKNLLKNTATSQTVSGVKFTVNDDGSVTANGTATAFAQIFINSSGFLKGGNYTISGGFSDNQRLFVRLGNIYHDSGSNEKNFSVSNDSTFICAIYIEAGEVCNNSVFYPMIRSADIEDDTYEPYTETVATLSNPITLYGIPTDSDGNFTDSDGQNWIADYIDVASGKVVRNVGNTDLSIVGAWFQATGWTNKECFRCDSLLPNAVPVKEYETIANIMCNRLRIERPNSIAFYISNTIGQGDGRSLFVAIAGITTSDDLIAYFDENETIVHYPLATPTEEDLPTEDIVALKNLKTFYNITHVMNDSEVKGEMVLSYNADTKMYIDNKFAELAAQLV